MAVTSLPEGPFTVVPALSRTGRNIFYGPHLHHRLNVYLNERRSPGGNGVLAIGHGGSNRTGDKTDFVEGSQSSSIGHLWLGYALSQLNSGHLPLAYDLISYDYSCHEHAVSVPGPLNSPYERTKERTNPGTMVQSWPTYMGKSADDVQRVWQWIRRNLLTEFWSWRQDAIFSMGHSFGAWGNMVAALRPSRPWNPQDPRPYPCYHEAKVRGVINWGGEIDFNPWFMAANVTMPGMGWVNSSGAQQRKDLETKFLIQDEDGLYPSNSPKNELCKSLSPVDLIQVAPTNRTDIMLHSYYRSDETGGTPVSTYSGEPPYSGGGHHPIQFGILDAAAMIADRRRADGRRMHSGRVIDPSAYSGGNSSEQLTFALESMLPETFLKMTQLVNP